jgi:glucose-6-phosphate 1-dehydrogenase
MSTAVTPGKRTASGAQSANQAPPADVLVICGITGNLARMMTFHSLYRLEARGLLHCPIVGVAANDSWHGPWMAT